MAYGSGGSCCSSGGDSVGSGVVNQITRYTTGTTANNRSGQTGDQIVSEYGPRYALAGNAGEIFSAANQTAVTHTVGLATTYTGFVLINPVNSGKNAEIIFASATVSVAASVAGNLGLILGGSAAGVTAFTAIATSLWGTTRADNNAATNGSVCSVAAAGITLVGTPRYALWLTSVGTGAVNLFSIAPAAIAELGGSISVGPGGYCAFGSYTAIATDVCAFVWRESFIQV